MADGAPAPDSALLNRIAALLDEFPGHAFCSDCLAKRLSLRPSVVWSAALALGESATFQLDVGFCSECLDRPKDVAHVRWMDPTEDVAPEAPSDTRMRFTIAREAQKEIAGLSSRKRSNGHQT